MRTLLVLGRASNLPTVWSNCLAGWLLGGAGSWWKLIVLLLGATMAYIGGMYLNDAFDADFDRQFRRERPIPMQAIPEELVWKIGWTLLGTGTLALCVLGVWAGIFAVLLSGSVVLYDWIHKRVTFSPVLMAACRFFLFLAAAAAGRDGVTGEALWTAIALAGWIVGLSYVARRESRRGAIAYWPLAVLALPFVLAALVNDGPWFVRFLKYSIMLAVWAGWCLSHTFKAAQRNIGRTVSGLLAGICLVDLLALSPQPGLSFVFLGLFLAALVGQRFVPAT